MLRVYFRLFHFISITGRENLPAGGAALFAANHQSYYDPLLVAMAQDLPICFMAWDELFRISGLFSRFITDWGAFPVDPEGNDTSGFRACLKLLRAGEQVLIFPEGGRSHDGRLMPMREGVARLAILGRAPIVPARIGGAEQAWPRGDLSPRPFFALRIHFAPPIHPRRVHGVAERHAESARIMRELEAALDPPRG